MDRARDYAIVRNALESGTGVDSQELAYSMPATDRRPRLLWSAGWTSRKPEYSGFVLNISERKAMEDELVRARLGADAAARRRASSWPT